MEGEEGRDEWTTREGERVDVIRRERWMDNGGEMEV